MGREGRPLCSYDPRYIPSDCTVHGVRITNVDTTEQRRLLNALKNRQDNVCRPGYTSCSLAKRNF